MKGHAVNSAIKKSRLLMLFALLIVGCSSVLPVFNVKDSPIIGVEDPTLESIKESILEVGKRGKWEMKIENDYHIVAKITVNKYRATVDIIFDTEKYNIIYRDSENLGYDGANISNRYNRWVIILERDIRKSIQTTKANKA